MRLLLIGCKYAGKTTLAREISNWMIDAMGLAYVRWHNHFVVPRLDGHLIVHSAGDATSIGKGESDLNTVEDEDQILALRPSVLEQLQRHNVWRHLHPDLFRSDDTLFIDHYYAEAVYAPLYYGYGEPGSFADRRAAERGPGTRNCCWRALTRFSYSSTHRPMSSGSGCDARPDRGAW